MLARREQQAKELRAKLAIKALSHSSAGIKLIRACNHFRWITDRPEQSEPELVALAEEALSSVLSRLAQLYQVKKSVLHDGLQGKPSEDPHPDL